MVGYARTKGDEVIETLQGGVNAVVAGVIILVIASKPRVQIFRWLKNARFLFRKPAPSLRVTRLPNNLDEKYLVYLALNISTPSDTPSEAMKVPRPTFKRVNFSPQAIVSGIVSRTHGDMPKDIVHGTQHVIVDVGQDRMRVISVKDEQGLSALRR
jgi:hypothetical protein